MPLPEMIVYPLATDGNAFAADSSYNLSPHGVVPFATIGGSPCAGPFAASKFFNMPQALLDFVNSKIVRSITFEVDVYLNDTLNGTAIFLLWAESLSSSVPTFYASFSFDGTTFTAGYSNFITVVNQEIPSLFNAWHTWKFENISSGGNTTLNVYLDGTLVGSATNTSNPFTATVGNIGVSRIPGFTSELSDGYIKNLKFYETRPGIPQAPEVDLILRKNGETLLRWKPVAHDSLGNRISPVGYRVYRSNNKNLETYDLVDTITDLDLSGVIRTIFNEKISGFYGYKVSAFNGSGEGPATPAVTIESLGDPDALN